MISLLCTVRCLGIKPLGLRCTVLLLPSRRMDLLSVTTCRFCEKVFCCMQHRKNHEVKSHRVPLYNVRRGINHFSSIRQSFALHMRKKFLYVESKKRSFIQCEQKQKLVDIRKTIYEHPPVRVKPADRKILVPKSKKLVKKNESEKKDVSLGDAQQNTMEKQFMVSEFISPVETGEEARNFVSPDENPADPDVFTTSTPIVDEEDLARSTTGTPLQSAKKRDTQPSRSLKYPKRKVTFKDIVDDMYTTANEATASTSSGLSCESNSTHTTNKALIISVNNNPGDIEPSIICTPKKVKIEDNVYDTAAKEATPNPSLGTSNMPDSTQSINRNMFMITGSNEYIATDNIADSSDSEDIQPSRSLNCTPREVKFTDTENYMCISDDETTPSTRHGPSSVSRSTQSANNSISKFTTPGDIAGDIQPNRSLNCTPRKVKLMDTVDDMYTTANEASLSTGLDPSNAPDSTQSIKMFMITGSNEFDITDNIVDSSDSEDIQPSRSLNCTPRDVKFTDTENYMGSSDDEITTNTRRGPSSVPRSTQSSNNASKYMISGNIAGDIQPSKSLNCTPRKAQFVDIVDHLYNTLEEATPRSSRSPNNVPDSTQSTSGNDIKIFYKLYI